MRHGFLMSSCLLALLSSVSASGQSSTQVFNYDALGRLASVTTSGGQSNGLAKSLCYDRAGNRTEYKSNSAGVIASCVAPTPSPSPTSGPAFAISDSSGTEGEVLQFAVTKTGGTSATYTVNFATAYGTAGSADFTATSGALSFGPADTTKYISVQTNSDLKVESTETFSVNLSSPSGGATITDGQGDGHIYDDGSGGGGGCKLC